ncbi:hypothetical protein E2F46_06265 [Luteimonas aestuarii]|uniref:Uncharacterized protein n=1 Tax=Luteimonas aestuarii TaxID=453837 RepID=A0A4R5TY94_9GAMM|nr:hypothetical protein [Luteimonas aestuarii]TDK26199.1 hypothetical protein E2F46_06265 [Luteimonas aestuarii]
MTKKIMCWHVDVDELVPEAGSARFVFKSRVQDKDGTVREEDVPIYLPFHVLESIQGVLPKVIQDLRAAGGDHVFKGALEEARARTERVEIITKLDPSSEDPRTLASGGAWPQAYAGMDEILGVSFGEVVPDTGCVLVDFRIRAVEGSGEIAEGSRKGILMAYSVLEDMVRGLPELRDMMIAQGLDKRLLVGAKGPVPAWNEGSHLRGLPHQPFLGSAFGVREIASELAAAVILLEISSIDPRQSGSSSADYLMPYHVLDELIEALPKVMRKMEQKGANRPQLRPH